MNKKNFFLRHFFFLMALMCTTLLQASTVHLSIEVNQPTSDQVSLKYQKDGNTDQLSIFRVTLGADQAASFQLDLSKATFVTLEYDRQTIDLFLEPNDDLQLQWSNNHLKSSLQFSGKGSQNNRILHQYSTQFGDLNQETYDGAYLKVLVDANEFHQSKSSTKSTYEQHLNQQFEKTTRFLNQHQSQLSSNLYQHLKANSLYHNATNRIAWSLAHPNESTKISLLPQQRLQDENMLSYSSYQNFLNAYALALHLPESLYKYKAHFAIYDKIETTFSGRVKYFLQAHLLKEVYNRSGDAELAFKHFQKFAANNPYSEYTDEVLAVYGGILSGTPDLAAPDFDMVDPNGKLIALSDYKGQVVYISFWASWCKPCIEGFKKSADIRQQLQDMGVVLLNVSIDKNDTAWESARIRHNPTGVNGLVLSLEDISKKYDISSIPLYHIVDKNGKFSYLTQNGQRNIIEEFRQLVER